jgi:hypothetical protein
MLSLSKHGGQAFTRALRQAQGDRPSFDYASFGDTQKLLYPKPI